MKCFSCYAELSSTTVFCPHCGERAQLDSELQATRLLVQNRGATLLTPANANSVLSDDRAREVWSWLTTEKEKGAE
jgi:hypothetical protein